MSLFKEKSKKDSVTVSASDKDAINSILGGEMTVVGDISFKGKVMVDGNIQGDIKGEYLILSESGKVVGDIEAGSFVCHGKVEGNVNAKRLFVKKTAKINGRVDAAELSVDVGASLQGEVVAHSQNQPGNEGLVLHQEDQSLHQDDQPLRQDDQFDETEPADEKGQEKKAKDKKGRSIDKLILANEEMA